MIEFSIKREGREVSLRISLKEHNHSTIRQKYSPQSFANFVKSLGDFRCDNSPYLDLSLPPEHVLNFDVFYDQRIYENSESRAFDNPDAAESFKKRLEDFFTSPEFENAINTIQSLEATEDKTELVFTKDATSFSLPEASNIRLPQISTPAYLIAGEEVYYLSLRKRAKFSSFLTEAKNKIEDAVREKEKILLQQMKEYKENLERRVAKIKENYSKLVIIPDFLFSEEAVKNKFLFFASSSLLHLYIPFFWRILYLKDSPKIYKIENPPHSKKLLLKITLKAVDPPHSYQVVRISLHHPGNLARFTHYHSLDQEKDCTGNIALPLIKTIADIIKFRNSLEKTIEVINKNDIAISDPPSLPSVDDLRLGEEVKVWKT